ncbi:hypothetical protein ACGFOU_18315 [Streptomyces sp. NPDC048595]|uniref:hypothetical protein n=1 Tax=Streptomyces sp. NPDC048595 TaxID=3365576 RepID=UPI0037198B80
MTAQTDRPHRPASTSTPAPRRGVDAALRTVTLAACVPYLSRKVAWIAGSRAGIPRGVLAGAGPLGYGRGRRPPVLAPPAAAWTGSAAPACRGGRLMPTALNRAPGGPGLPTPVRALTYSVQMITGILAAGAGAHLFAERRAAHTAGSASGAGAGSGAVRCD